MTSQPLVSIGVPIHNEAQYLSETLDSLLGQDYENIEVVISDNASTDDTEDTCLAYVSRDKRIRYYREAMNRGSLYNFDRVLRLSAGKYFMWASGHDLRAPSLIRRCVQALEERPELVLCYPRTLLLPFGGGPSREMNWDTLETTGLPPAKRLKHVVMRLSYGNAIYGVVRSAALERITLDARNWTDLSLLGQLSLQGEFHQIEDRLFFRRENRSPVSREENAARQRAMLDPHDLRSGPRYPSFSKGLVLLRAVWRAPGDPVFRLILILRSAFWVGVPACAGCISGWFPHLRHFYDTHHGFARVWRSFWGLGSTGDPGGSRPSGGPPA